jgi:putative aldouronate transport system permease protein
MDSVVSSKKAGARDRSSRPLPRRTESARRVARDVVRDRFLYLLVLPGLLYFLIFCYGPMWGLLISFKEFNMYKGFNASPWVGLGQFVTLFRSTDFGQKFMNTLIISSLKILFGFPAPIILAILINEIRTRWFKKLTQTVLYLPYFVSWVVLAGILTVFLNPSDGVINIAIKAFGGTPVDFLHEPAWFRQVIVASDVYKNVGWGTVVYLASMSGIDPDLYEASWMDGANKWKQIVHITLPSIKGVIVILFILNLGNILNAGFEQIFLIYSPNVYPVADIIDTYVYRKGIMNASYSLGTAAGLFKSVIALTMILLTNAAAKKLGEEGVW